MKRTLAVILVMLFGVVGLAYAQSAKDVYKAVKKAELSATGSPAAFANAMVNAQTEYDLFKDSSEAKKNPEFTSHIGKALGGLAMVQFSRDPNMTMGFVLMEQQKGKGSAGPDPATRFKEGMDTATRELELAKKYLGLTETIPVKSATETIKPSDIPAGKRIDYSGKIDELHRKMKIEFDILAQSDPKNAVAVSVGVISNVKKLISERDNLKFEALKYYHRNLPPDLSKKFEESERLTEQVKKTMR